MKLTVSFKNHFIREYFIDQDEVIIGSNEDADLHIDSLAIHPQHCRVILHNGALHIESLNPNNIVLVNDEAVDTSRLSNGDTIKVGKHTLLFSCNTQEPMALPHKQKGLQEDLHGCLQMLSGDNLGRIIRLHKSINKLGKAGTTSAVIKQQQSGYFISTPKGSLAKIGTVAISPEPQRLNDGDIIEVDGITMQFFIDH